VVGERLINVLKVGSIPTARTRGVNMSFEDQLLNTLDEILGELRDINAKLDRSADVVYSVTIKDPDRLSKALRGLASKDDLKGIL
jgi:hypothetical protein